MAESVYDLASGASSAATQLIRADLRFVAGPLPENRSRTDPRVRRTTA
ncbi:MAG TPA: hypothetical protein VIH81_16325 [Roseiarcus sp.]|jgi:hypothetical protein